MIFARPKLLRRYFIAAVLLAVLAVGLVFSGVIPVARPPIFSDADYGPAQIAYKKIGFAELPGWLKDDPSPALGAFLRSCTAFEAEEDDSPANPFENHSLLSKGVSFGGAIADWRAPCADASALATRSHANPAARRSGVRAFFEGDFQPLEIISRRELRPGIRARNAGAAINKTGVFTGYFEPIYPASRKESQRFNSPVYPRPDDLIEVDLGVFREELRGTVIAGRNDNGWLVPYSDRSEIAAGALASVLTPIAWMNPNDLFFLQVQGSGRLRLDDGELIRVGYAAQNGHAYTSIGRVMAERGMMVTSEISMQSILRWLESASPNDARELREQNASYVFFRKLELDDPDLGPLGAQGAALTPERSLAVDRRFHMLGAPVWVDIDPVEPAGPGRIQRLMIAQDTGGAIKGPLRGDVFWGSGAHAGDIAGIMNARGRLFVLVPRAIADRLPQRAQ